MSINLREFKSVNDYIHGPTEKYKENRNVNDIFVSLVNSLSDIASLSHKTYTTLSSSFADIMKVIRRVSLRHTTTGRR